MGMIRKFSSVMTVGMIDYRPPRAVKARAAKAQAKALKKMARKGVRPTGF